MAFKTLNWLLLLGANVALVAEALEPIRAQSVNTWLRTKARTAKHNLADVEHQRVFARPPEFPELYFEQPLDHFSNDTSLVFGQRYWVNSRHYVEGGPVFVIDGGETSGEGDFVPFPSVIFRSSCSNNAYDHSTAPKIVCPFSIMALQIF